MQRILFFFFFILIVPSSIFGLEELSDHELGTVSGQVGISIAIDDIVIYQSTGRTSFVDDDGGNLATNPWVQETSLGLGRAASLNLDDLEIDVLRLNALAYDQTTGIKRIGSNDPHFRFIDSNYLTLSGSTVSAYDIKNEEYITITPRGLDIDINDELPCLSPGYNYMMSAKYSTNLLTMIPQPSAEVWNKVGVAIWFPSLDIYMDELNLGGITVTDLDNTNGTSVNNEGSMMRIGMEGVNVASLYGEAEIAPHYSTGVDMAVDDIVMYMNIDKLKFTDTDGHNGVPGSGASLSIEGIKADLIRVNAITHTNISLLTVASYLFGSNSINIESPMLFNCHLDNLNNMLMLDLADTLKSWHAQPLLINVTPCAGFTTATYAANLGYGFDDAPDVVMGGLFISAGTMELFADSMSIDKIKIEDPQNMAINNNASFFPIKLTNVTTATLGGYMEVTAH